jgi:hypothetical protein
MTATIRRHQAVRITKTDSLQFGRLGIVTSVSKSTGRITVELAQTPDDQIESLTVAAHDVTLDKFVEASVLPEFDAQRAANRAAYEARVAVIAAEREATYRDEYIAKRRQPVTPFVREVRDERYTIFGEQRDNGWVRDMITISNRTNWKVQPDVNVNWSAVGEVSPEEALAFAQALAAAAVEAMAIRAQREREAGITI